MTAADLTDMRVLLDQRAELALEIKDRKDRLEVLDAQIKERMGDREEATVDGRPAATWKWSYPSALDQTLLKTRYPQAARECTTTRGKRTFLVPWTPTSDVVREPVDVGPDTIVSTSPIPDAGWPAMTGDAGF